MPAAARRPLHGQRRLHNDAWWACVALRWPRLTAVQLLYLTVAWGVLVTLSAAADGAADDLPSGASPRAPPTPLAVATPLPVSTRPSRCLLQSRQSVDVRGSESEVVDELSLSDADSKPPEPGESLPVASEAKVPARAEQEKEHAAVPVQPAAPPLGVSHLPSLGHESHVQPARDSKEHDDSHSLGAQAVPAQPAAPPLDASPLSSSDHEVRERPAPDSPEAPALPAAPPLDASPLSLFAHVSLASTADTVKLSARSMLQEASVLVKQLAAKQGVSENLLLVALVILTFAFVVFVLYLLQHIWRETEQGRQASAEGSRGQGARSLPPARGNDRLVVESAGVPSKGYSKEFPERRAMAHVTTTSSPGMGLLPKRSIEQLPNVRQGDMQALKKALCPGLVVPRCSECLLAVPTVQSCGIPPQSEATFIVRDFHGQQVIRCDVRRPVWSRNERSTIVVLRAVSPRIHEEYPPVLGYCQAGPFLDVQKSVMIQDANQEPFASLVKDPRRPFYAMAQVAGGPMVVFEGNFAEMSVSITDDNQALLADTFPTDVDFDPVQQKYFKLRVNSRVDVGVLLCCLVSIQLMELQ